MEALLIARDEMADRERFLDVVDAFGEARARAGGRTAGGGALTALIAFPTRAAAEAFDRDADRRAALERATVTGHADEVLDVLRPPAAAA